MPQSNVTKSFDKLQNKALKMTIPVKNGKVFHYSGKPCLCNHANLKPEAYMINIYSNVVVLHKKKIGCQRKRVTFSFNIKYFFCLFYPNTTKIKSKNCIPYVWGYMLKFVLKRTLIFLFI